MIDPPDIKTNNPNNPVLEVDETFLEEFLNLLLIITSTLSTVASTVPEQVISSSNSDNSAESAEHLLLGVRAVTRLMTTGASSLALQLLNHPEPTTFQEPCVIYLERLWTRISILFSDPSLYTIFQDEKEKEEILDNFIILLLKINGAIIINDKNRKYNFKFLTTNIPGPYRQRVGVVLLKAATVGRVAVALERQIQHLVDMTRLEGTDTTAALLALTAIANLNSSPAACKHTSTSLSLSHTHTHTLSLSLSFILIEKTL